MTSSSKNNKRDDDDDFTKQKMIEPEEFGFYNLAEERPIVPPKAPPLRSTINTVTPSTPLDRPVLSKPPTITRTTSTTKNKKKKQRRWIGDTGAVDFKDLEFLASSSPSSSSSSPSSSSTTKSPKKRTDSKDKVSKSKQQETIQEQPQKWPWQSKNIEEVQQPQQESGNGVTSLALGSMVTAAGGLLAAVASTTTTTTSSSSSNKNSNKKKVTSKANAKKKSSKNKKTSFVPATQAFVQQTARGVDQMAKQTVREVDQIAKQTARGMDQMAKQTVRGVDKKAQEGRQWLSDNIVSRVPTQLPWINNKEIANPNDRLAAQSERIIRERGILSWLLFNKEKLPWTLSCLVSLVYLLAFVSRVSCDKAGSGMALLGGVDIAEEFCWNPLIEMTEGLHEGFCVWGSNADTGLCASELSNSHQFSFYVDMGMAFMAFVVGHKAKPYASKWLVMGIAQIIGVHGLLHVGISNGVECTRDEWMHCWMSCPGTTPSPTQPWQWVLYTFYNFGLVLMNFAMANFRLPKAAQGVLVVIITAVFVALGAFFGGTWALPAVFVQSHAMVSLTGIFANQEKITPLMGWLFLGSTLVGLTEFLACKPFLLQRYGHVWYDAILHLAMISSLIPRSKGVSI